MGDREKSLTDQLNDLAATLPESSAHVLRRAARRLRELERWMQADEAFYRTRLGAMFEHLKAEFRHCEFERSHYRRLVEKWVATQADPPVIREMLKPLREAE